MLSRGCCFKELVARFLTASFLLILLAFSVRSLSPFVVAIIVGMLLISSLFEWRRFFSRSLPKKRILDLMVFFAVISYGFLALYLPKSLAMNIGLVFSGLWILLPFALLGYSVDRWCMSVSTAFLGIMCILVGWLSMFWILRFFGAKLLFWSVSIVIIIDSCAYFSGRLLGRTPLAPSISPCKSFEGLCGAYSGTVLLLTLFDFFRFGVFRLSIGGACFFVAAVFVFYAVSGDLVESALKRVAGLKDSGNLLPGHGGILDRFDSYFAIMPLLFCVLTYFSMTHPS